ncbi:unnamed protein product [Lota lota]
MAHIIFCLYSLTELCLFKGPSPGEMSWLLYPSAGGVQGRCNATSEGEGALLVRRSKGTRPLYSTARPPPPHCGGPSCPIDQHRQFGCHRDSGFPPRRKLVIHHYGKRP